MDFTKMDIGDRIKYVREDKGLSQAALGEKVSLERSAISLIERKQRNATERTVKDICRELNVDYIWLTTGEGSPYINNDDDIIEAIDRIMIGENEFHKNLFKTFARLDEDELLALERIIDKFIEVSKEKD